MDRLRLTRTWLLAVWLGLLTAALPLSAFAQEEDGAAAAFTLICTCLIFIVSIAIPIGAAWWVYNDAKKLGNPNAVLWAVLTFFTTIIGLILYFIIGRSQTTVGGPPSGPAPPAGPSNTVRY